MNTSQFTYRDFVTYFLTGILFIVGMVVVFSDEFNTKISTICDKYKFLAYIQVLATIATIAIIYFIGHLIHWADYTIMKFYLCLYKMNKKYELKIVYWIRKLFEILIYKHRIAYQVANTLKKKGDEKLPFNSNDSFWETCAELQATNRYASCEYWYSLNDLFKGLYFVCLSVTSIVLCKGKIEITIIASILAFITYWRARQFSEYFVTTVIRIKKIEIETDKF